MTPKDIAKQLRLDAARVKREAKAEAKRLTADAEQTSKRLRHAAQVLDPIPSREPSPASAAGDHDRQYT